MPHTHSMMAALMPHTHSMMTAALIPPHSQHDDSTHTTLKSSQYSVESRVLYLDIFSS